MGYDHRRDAWNEYWAADVVGHLAAEYRLSVEEADELCCEVIDSLGTRASREDIENRFEELVQKDVGGKDLRLPGAVARTDSGYGTRQAPPNTGRRGRTEKEPSSPAAGIGRFSGIFRNSSHNCQ